jgi:hypothetical protein
VVVVVVVVVVAAGEVAAWAGTITDLTTGLTQRSGKTSGLNEPPPNAACKMRRRSTVMVEGPPLGALDAPPEHSQNIRLRGSSQARTFRPVGIAGLASGSWGYPCRPGGASRRDPPFGKGVRSVRPGARGQTKECFQTRLRHRGRLKAPDHVGFLGHDPGPGGLLVERAISPPPSSLPRPRNG